MNTTNYYSDQVEMPYGRSKELARQLYTLTKLAVRVQSFRWDAYGIYHRYFQVAEVVEKEADKSARKRRSSKQATESETSSVPENLTIHGSEVEYAWNTLVQNAWQTHNAMVKGIRTAKNALKTLSSLGIDPTARELGIQLSGDWQCSPFRAKIMRDLTHCGLDPFILEALDTRMREANGNWSEIVGADTLAGAVVRLEELSDQFRDFIKDKMLFASDPKTMKQSLSRITPISDDTSDDTVTIDCSELEDEAGIICTVVVVVLIVVSVVTWLIDWIGDLIESSEDDERARADINTRTCAELVALSNDHLASLIRRLQDGPTLDSDERAILRVLGCLPCDRVRVIVGMIGRASLLFDFDGAERDRLLVRLHECGLAAFRDWDDDATRIFISEATCATINDLTDEEIGQLMFNLFEGHTGDEDEAAILKVMNCLPCPRIGSLLRMPGTSIEDFRYEFDGEELDQLERRFRACGF